MKITRKQLIKLIKEQLDSSLFHSSVFPDETEDLHPTDIVDRDSPELTFGHPLRKDFLRQVKEPKGKYKPLKNIDEFDDGIMSPEEAAEFLGYGSVEEMDAALLDRYGRLYASESKEESDLEDIIRRHMAQARGGDTGAKQPSEDTGSWLFPKNESRIRGLIRKVLLEGGNAFEGTYEGRIPANDVKSIVIAFNLAVLNKIGLKGLPAGSTRDPSPERGAGDIDLVINSDDKVMIREKVASILGPENVKFVGQLVCAKFPYEGLGYVQIDLIPSATPEDTQWQMSGGSATGAKGIFRNLLLAFFAKKAGEKESMERGEEGSVKYTLAWPGGLMKKEKTGEKIPTRGKNKGIPEPIYSDSFKSRISNPAEFLPMIDVNLSPEQASNFESLVKASLNDSILRDYVIEFSKILDPENNRIINRSPAMIDAANKVIEYIQSKI